MPTRERDYASTAVFASEIVKLVVSTFLEVRRQGWTKTYRSIFSRDSWKLAIPALLYTVQNNLQYVAISNLEAATFHLMHQLKILSTAVFTVMILKLKLSATQWVSLILLTMGVALIQIPQGQLMALIYDNKVNTVHAPKIKTNQFNTSLEITAVLCACLISGLSGVYFEKVLKDTVSVSLWARNIQLSLFSLLPALLFGVMLKDGQDILNHGFFYGYNIVVWLNLVMQALAGLIVSLCVKNADNIAKNFATSLAIVLSFVSSIYLLDFTVSGNFIIGSTVAILATFVYSSSRVKKSLGEKDEAETLVK